MQSDWTFDTIRTTSAMGTFRNMAKDIMPPGMVPDEEEEETIGEASSNDVRSSYTSGVATRGSDPKLLGSNQDASHSTVVIKPLPEEQDIQTLLADAISSENAETSERPSTPPQQEPPPAYTGSVRSTRRASYAARNNLNGPGTVMREADLGSGVDTIRPVKKVDTIGSLRLSSEYVGNLREGAGPSSPTSPIKKDSSSRRVASEAMKAGRSLVDDVVLPTCERVRCSALDLTRSNSWLVDDQGRYGCAGNRISEHDLERFR